VWPKNYQNEPYKAKNKAIASTKTCFQISVWPDRKKHTTLAQLCSLQFFPHNNTQWSTGEKGKYFF